MIDHIYKSGAKFTIIVYDPDYDLVVRCTIDNKVKIFSEKGGSLIYELDVSPFTFTYAYIVKVVSLNNKEIILN